MIKAIIMVNATAADPISFALPDNICRSVLILSVKASMAEFSNSTIRISNNEQINTTQCSNDEANQNENGSKIILTSNSCLNATSTLNAALIPK